MIVKKWLLVTFGTAALGIGGFAVSVQAAKQQCASEECACEQALEQNSVEALEEFLKKYPQSVNNKDSACAAMAVPPEEFDSGGQGYKDNDVTVQPELTPSEG